MHPGSIVLPPDTTSRCESNGIRILIISTQISKQHFPGRFQEKIRSCNALVLNKKFILNLRIHILRLRIHILRLEIYILRLRINFYPRIDGLLFRKYKESDRRVNAISPKHADTLPPLRPMGADNAAALFTQFVGRHHILKQKISIFATIRQTI